MPSSTIAWAASSFAVRSDSGDGVSQRRFVGLKADLGVVEPGGAQPSGPRPVQTEAAGDQVRVKAGRAGRGNQLGEIGPK